MPKPYMKLPPLELEPDLYRALNDHAKSLGIPRARLIREILRTFLAPRVKVNERLESVQEGALGQESIT